MSEYYRDQEHLYEIYNYFLDQVLRDEKIGPKMSRAKIIIKFIYTDPDSEITIDLKKPAGQRGHVRHVLPGAVRPKRGRLVQAECRPLPPLLARV